MTVCRQQILCAAAVGALLPSTVAAEAGSPQGDEQSARYHLVYEAPPECPPKNALRAQINRRISSDWEASTDQEAGTLTIAIRKAGERYEARLTLADRWNRVAFRDLEGDLCEEALSELAVVAVAAIESRLGAQPAYFEFGASFGPDWRTGLVAWSVGGLIGLRWPTSQRSLQFAFAYSATGRDDANRATDVKIGFSSLSLRLDLCPIAPRLNETISFPLCVGAEGGWLHASPPTSTGPSVLTSSWLAFGITPQIRLRRGNYFLHFSPRVDLVAHPREVTDTPRRDGQPSPNATVHTINPIGFALFAAIGAALP